MGPAGDDIVTRLTTPAGLTGLLAAQFAIVSTLAGEHPTALWWWNPVLTAGFTLVVCLAAAQSHWACSAFAGAVAALAVGTLGGALLWTVMAIIGVFLALASADGAAWRRHGLRATSAGLAALALYRIPSVDVFGIPSLIATVAIFPTLFAGWKSRAARQLRKTRGWQIARDVVLVVAMATLATFAAAAVFARPLPGNALESMRSARDGDFAGAGVAAQAAAKDARRTSLALNGPWAWPARLVPVVSQHVSFAGIAARGSADVATAASQAITAAADKPLQSADGAINLGLIEAITPPTMRATAAIDELTNWATSASTDWLIAGYEIEQRRPRLLESAQAVGSGGQLLENLPYLLGGSEPMRYFVIFGNPAESRELGGFLSAYAVIELHQGRLSLIEAGDNNDFISHVENSGRSLQDPERYSPWFATLVEKYPQNITSSPSLEEVASATRDLAGPIGGRDLNGVLYLDVYAVQALVGLLGEVRIAQAPQPLTGSSTADYLLVGQYEAFDNSAERKDVLVSLAEELFPLLLSAPLPPPQVLFEQLEPLVNQKRIQLATFEPGVNDALNGVNLLSRYPAPDASSDFLAVNNHNTGPSKLDTWLRRSVNYTVKFDASTGRYTSQLEVVLSNDVPAQVPEYVLGSPAPNGPLGERAPHTNRTTVSIYTPNILRSIAAPGNPEARFVSWDELGYQRHTVTLDVQQGQSATITADFEGLLNANEYQLLVASQPLVNPDPITIEVSNSQVGSSNRWPYRIEATQSEDLKLDEPMQTQVAG